MQEQTQRTMGQNIAEKAGYSLSINLGNLIDYGCGLYSGFMDGQGTPSMRPLLLSTPFIADVASTGLAVYAFTKIGSIRSKYINELEEKMLVGELSPEENKELGLGKQIERSLPKTSKLLKCLPRKLGTTAVKVGIGYSIGYTVGSYLK